jgi:glutathione S-transferase
MSDFTIYGPAMSTFVRTVRMACAEKGVACRLEEVDFRSETYRKLHPFNRIPAAKHGDFVLYESGAIMRYVDRTFPGLALQPKESRALALQDQWLSAIGDYLYQVMIRELVWQRLVVPMQGGKPNEDLIKAAVPKLDYQLGVLAATLAKSPYLAGDAMSLADLALFPILSYVRATPEGQAALKKAPAVVAWYDRMASRASAAATDPSAKR